MPFQKVRSAREGDPLHEFYVTTEQVDADPDTYEVLDPEPVDVPGPVVYVETSPAPAVEKKPGGRVKEKTDAS